MRWLVGWKLWCLMISLACNWPPRTNVRLASQLSGWYIDILTEAEESERRQEEFKTRSARFIDALNIDDVIAHLLVAEGFVFPKMWLKLS